MYVGDTENHRIQLYDVDGIYIATWGSMGTGDGEFMNPTDIAVDVVGRVYVADTGNDRFQRFTKQGAFDGAWGETGFPPGYFHSPSGIAIGTARNVYVADFSGSIVANPKGTATPTEIMEPSGSVTFLVV